MTAVTAVGPAGPPGLLSRRAFLVGGVAATAASALLRPAFGHHTASSAAGAVGSSTTAPLALATFAPLVGSTFVVSAGGRRVPIVLDEAVRTPRQSPMSRPVPASGVAPGEQFSLLFRGSAAHRVPAAIHTLHHPDLGSFALYLQPVGRGLKGQDYEATVDRRRASRPAPSNTSKRLESVVHR